MESEHKNLMRVEQSGEILNSFRLARELFDFAQDNLDQTNGLRYSDPEYESVGRKAVELPGKFASLVAEYPEKYFVVSCENRQGTYYAPGTRFRWVKLSTSEHKYDSDEKLREIEITEYDPSEGKGNVIFVKVRDSVNEKSAIDLNTSTGLETDESCGFADIKYEVDATGGKKVVESKFNRLDEGVFPWRGGEKPVRWVRNLRIENLGDSASKISYEDLYIIKDEKGETEEQAQVRTHIAVNNGEKKIVVEIGIGALSSAKVLFKNEDNTVLVVEHSPEGMKALTNQMEIIKQDPNYAFVFEVPVDEMKVLKFVESKIAMLESDWNKRNTVFGAKEIKGADKGMIGQ